MRLLLSVISLLAFLIGAVVLAATFRAGVEPGSFVLGMFAALAAAAAPEAALAAVLFALPVFGNKPATPHCWYLTVICAGLACGSGLVRIGEFLRRRRVPVSNSVGREFLLFAAILYLIGSVSSLLALPLGRTVETAWAAISSAGNIRQSISTAAYWIGGLFLLPEDRPDYPLASVLKTILAFQFGLLIYGSIERRGRQDQAKSEAAAVRLCSAILGGTVSAVVCGLIQYYYPIGLERLRPLDPTANAGGVEFRLQSFFGHSGWFAEYLTLTIPFSMVVLLAARTFAVRAGAVIAILLLGEFALILSYQRGGWISYPLTLLAVWAAIYAFRADEKSGGEGLKFGSVVRSSIAKILLSVPLTVIVSMSIIWTIQHAVPQAAGGVTSYVERFKDIGKTSDRTDFMRAGAKIAALHPFLGGGSESFAIEFDREFDSPSGAYFHQIDLPLHGSAHNVFFQTASGKGFGGLALLLLVVGSLGATGLRVFTRSGLSRGQIAIGLIAACFSAAFLIYGNVQEIFYVYPLEVLFFAVVGIAAAAGPADFRSNSRLRNSLSGLVAFLFVAHIGWELVWPGRTGARNNSEPFGCFAQEVDGQGAAYRWCGPRARLNIPVTEAGGVRAVSFAVRAPLSVHPGNRLRVLIGGQTVFDEELEIGSERRIVASLPAGTPQEKPEAAVEFESTSLVIPARDLPGSRDFRLLSFQVLS